ncbi:hypothetical protein LCGC14_1145340 [marine sediment metagenome]|uniref:Uncharacterized protein n=1 Tax=marine sediment metagenome TaxID=412755 RepID=A0A0F9PF61_9ZZZZ
MKRKEQVSQYLVLRHLPTGLFYIGQICIDLDGLVQPCSKISDFFETFGEAEDELKELKGEKDV